MPYGGRGRRNRSSECDGRTSNGLSWHGSASGAHALDDQELREPGTAYALAGECRESPTPADVVSSIVEGQLASLQESWETTGHHSAIARPRSLWRTGGS